MLEKIRVFLVEEYGLKGEEITADKELTKDPVSYTHLTLPTN